MAEILLLNQPFVICGLDTMNYTVVTDGLYSVQVQLTEVPPSGISILVKKNGSTIFTAPALAIAQGAIQFKFGFSAVATDAISVVISSSQTGPSAIDNQLNTVKSTVYIQQGL